ncbi:seipin-2 [Mercurialis annua]|uniref:seipin-2 n=1 Tax=Mercurialis annua TaxID=3986 RepID=UPI00215E548E|nr:seipin-2 [Mercurialis annua]
MDPSNQTDEPDQNDADCFHDALDDFQFHDCSITDPSIESTSVSTMSESKPEENSTPATATTLRNRRGVSKETNSESSDITQMNNSKPRYANIIKEKKRYRLYRDLKENEKNLDTGESTRSSCDRVGSDNRADSVTDENKMSVGETSPDNGNLLEFVAGLVVKAIGFQFNLFINFITFPIWGVYNLYMFVVDPFGVMRSCKSFLMQKFVSLWSLTSGVLVSPVITDWLKEQKSMWNVMLRFGWGMFWSGYVCVILCGLLVSSIMVSGVLMRYVVENPVEIKEELYFDYTQNCPVAFVPIMSCVDCGLNCEDRSLAGRRVIPPNHKLQANVLLTLPESGYNRNLGIFQIRVDFVSADGKILASKRQPCMLRFKSEPIRALLTFFKVAPLVAGYISESQTLKVKIRGFTERVVPTSCLKVIIEQRAEKRPGAGIPELYDASLVLESELPVYKRLIWYWKKTMFVWMSMILFVMQLLFTLICCRPIIIPRTRPRNVSAVVNSLETMSQN